jgi:regulator of protease activity HflC (stomatin/prohibitin superfamily)
VTERLTAIPLKQNQYVRLLDTRTGIIRIERGERSVSLEPTEELLEEVQEGINIDEQTAVLLRDIHTGQLELITTPQVFIPAAHQEIVEPRRRITLEDHDTVVIKDRTGRYLFRRGSDTERAFFLAPYESLMRLHWSAGISKDKRTLTITHIDTRPKFMWYEFEVRTQDNVDLVVGVTFFWQITDVEAMIRTTDDAPGDICSHARSMIIQAVSQVTLERFLSAFNAIVHAAVFDTNLVFYTERGVRVHAVEVRSITCKDAATQRVLQEIIQETTNRLNRLQKQESENEVKLKQLAGDIESEQLKGQLLAIQREHSRLEALIDGEAEALRVQAFFDGVGEQVDIADKIALFNTLRKQDVIEVLSRGTAQLYFTPSDVDLSIESRQRNR